MQLEDDCLPGFILSKVMTEFWVYLTNVIIESEAIK